MLEMVHRTGRRVVGLLFFSLGFCLVVMAPGLLYSEQAGIVVFPVDTPSILRNNKGVKAEPLTPLEYGDLMNTRSQDRLKLKGEAGFFLTLSGETEVLLKKEASPVVLVNYGSVEFLNAEENEALRLRTPILEVTPREDTHLFLVQRSEGSKLFVFSGSVLIRSGEKSMELPSGKFLAMEEGMGVLPEPKNIEYSEARALLSSFLVTPPLSPSQSFWVLPYFRGKLMRSFEEYRFAYAPLTVPWLTPAEHLLSRTPGQTPRATLPLPSSTLKVEFQIQENR